MIITIDGPSASGKSTIARLLSKKLNFFYINSGLLFRALAYIFFTKYRLAENEFKNIQYKDLIQLINQDLTYKYINGRAQVFFQSNDITSCLYGPHIGQGASIIGENQFVRKIILEYQRSLAQDFNVIADGRDCGTEVFPFADYKFFLFASPHVRALRWQQSQKRKGKNYTFEEALAWIEQKDKRDSEREIAPLKPAEDAIIIDNSNLTIEETLIKILTIVNKN